ncbi:MAG: hypothetical protein V3U24_06450 [Candidatus Neomarinimicrobiota bacterium]
MTVRLRRYLVLLFLPMAIIPFRVLGWNLTYLNSFSPLNYELLDVEISGNYAYIPGGLDGLGILDISDPSSPQIVGLYYASGCEFGRMYAWHVSENFAYGSGRYCGIEVLDVTNPSNPAHVADYGLRGRSYEHSDGSGAYLFAAAHTDGVEIIDVTTPDSPQFVALVPTENAWAVEVSEAGNLVYVADGAGGLKIIDVSYPEVAHLLGSVATSGTAKDVAAAGHFVFVAVGAGGVDMIDVSNSGNPVLVANYNTTGYASRVAVNDSLVAVSDWDDVEILRWDDSPSMSIAGYKNTGGRVMAVDMIGDIVYSAEWITFRSFRFEPVEGPDLDVSTRHVDIPYTELGECRDATITLANNGMETLIIDEITVSHTDYEITLSAEDILPGATVEGIIKYCATTESGHTSLRIRSNDSDEPVVLVVLEGNSPWGLEVGQEAPDFTLPSVNGFGDISLNELQDQVVVIAFFASW